MLLHLELLLLQQGLPSLSSPERTNRDRSERPRKIQSAARYHAHWRSVGEGQLQGMPAPFQGSNIAEKRYLSEPLTDKRSPPRQPVAAKI